MKMALHSCKRDTTRRQHGAYAVEFALTFVVFFAVCYAIITYALIFTAQQVLNVAADDAARVALRWHDGTTPQSRADRLADVQQTVQYRTEWLARVRGAPLDVVFCEGQHARGGCGNGCDPRCPTYFPDAAFAASDAVGIAVLYPYQQAPLVPMLVPGPWAGVVLPTQLGARSLVSGQSGIVSASLP